ncbi:MAG: hypothetical protein NTV86_03190 [Planctomycetota bacterium]|nr:hypothetical protein [Planctomycetota bacterium]
MWAVLTAVLLAVATGATPAGPAPGGPAVESAEAAIRRCPAVAFIKRQAGGLSGTNATMLAQRTGVGAAICIYNPPEPGKPARTIFEDKGGFIFDMSASYDGARLVFAYKKDVARRVDSFHIYEINIDGTGLRPLTAGPFHDVSPAYLPDGRIVFNSTRVESFSVCQDFLAAALYVIDGDGGDLHRLEFSTLCDCTPFVMEDGRILFTRWEYQDKNIFCTEGLWTVNPDGTRVQLFYGNTLTVPNAMYGARQIPGTGKVVCVMAAHHYPPLGGIAIIDPRQGQENPAAMTTLTPEVPYRPTVGATWRDCNWGPGDAFYPWSFTDPWPLAQDLFLVSYGGPLQGGPQRYRLFLLTDKGRKIPLYEDPATSCYNPVPLAPRPRPLALPAKPAPAGGEGAFYVADIYQGLGSGVKRGDVKELRILSQSPKKWNTEGPRYNDHYPVIGYGSYYVKVLLGTVPVHEDGTAYFKAPAGIELYFEAVDADGKEIRRMGTVTQIMPGEVQGCIGCHEPRTQAPSNGKLGVSARLARGPDAIAPPPWGAGPVSYIKQVQPVLDQYCVRCHEGPAPKGKLDLSGDRDRLFCMSYENLISRGLVDYYYINQGPTGNFPPLQSGARVSRLTKLIEAAHADVKVDDLSRRKLYAWIDANCPYYDTWDMSRPHSLGGRDAWTVPNGGNPQPAPWRADFDKLFAAHCASCHNPDVPHTWINLSRPQHSRVLAAHLDVAAGGLGIQAPRDGRKPPIFQSTADPTYQSLLRILQAAKETLDAHPRMDMPGGKPLPQERSFGKTF